MVVHDPALLHIAVPRKRASGQLIHTTGPSADKVGTNLQGVVTAPGPCKASQVQGHASRARSCGGRNGVLVGESHTQCHDLWWWAPQNHMALSLR